MVQASHASVSVSAARMTSPSFSRSAASQTSTGLPARSAVSASSMVFEGRASMVPEGLDWPVAVRESGR